MRRILLGVLVLALGLSLPGAAQHRRPRRRPPPGPPSRWSFEIFGGVNPTLGETRGHLDFGGHVGAGAGYRFSPHWLGLAQFSYYGFGLDSRVLQENSVPSGNAHMWVLTLDPEWRFARGSRTAYLVGGVGYYDRVVQFTQPTEAQTIIFDPWFGYFGPALVPADIVLGTFASHALGFNAGLGYEWRIEGGGAEPPMHVFAEARLHYANTRGRATLMLPVTVGVRF